MAAIADTTPREEAIVECAGKEASRPAHRALVEALLAWFAAEKRPLPWRERYDPYAVWISEIMLQQTQMERGAQYFVRWMERFPTLRHVAEATPDALLKAWEGLGYYSRVRNLHKAAQRIMDEHNGVVPDDMAALRALPGIGEYTAGAVLSIAYNKPVPAVDANVERVFARVFDVGHPVKSRVAAGFIRDMAEALMSEALTPEAPGAGPREFSQAVMELGALVCGKTPRCQVCPIAAHCQARRLGITAERPVPGKKTTYSALSIVTGVLVHKGRIFLQKRLDSGVWAGFWEFPGGRLEEGETPEQAVVREFAEETAFAVRPLAALGLVRHAYTRYKIAMHCFVCGLEDYGKATADGLPLPELSAATEYRWVRPGELEAFTLPAGHRKLADAWMGIIEQFAGESG